MNNDLQRAEDEARFLLSKYASTAESQAIEHLAGAILLAAVTIAKALDTRSSGDKGE